MPGKPRDRREARQLIENIGRQRGYVSDATLRQLDEAGRREIETVVHGMGTLLGNSVKILATQLYASNARFIFELLQNADDNHYSEARAAGDDPYVRFAVYRDRIVVECNEDGFTNENLEAICAVDQSSKVAMEGYIGQKGIGFKSVFMAAWKVHIRSGHFSFCFQHRPDDVDMGMGMIRPIWEEPEEELAGTLTRFVLLLHDNGDPEKLASDREGIARQFDELGATVLLFLKNIKRITIDRYDDGNALTSSRRFSIDASATVGDRIVINTSHEYCNEGVLEKDEERHIYHVTRYTATNLAKNENRKYSREEEDSRSYSTSEVVLAFPLDEDEEPLVEEQEVFAFLPLRRMGFDFIIQADFVTQANRQDIITSSRRNVGLLDGVAGAFIKAVLQFCEHHTLQYCWMRYLPQESSFHWDNYWKRLLDDIKTRLAETPVMRPFGRASSFRRIANVSRRFQSYNDQYGKPLFPELSPNSWLGDGYENCDLDLLTSYGLGVPVMTHIIQAVRRDLSNPTSVMKSPDTDQDWHSRAAHLISTPFQQRWPYEIGETKGLGLIPLCDGQWVSAAGRAIYYPITNDGIAVPRDLSSLQLVQPDAIKIANRKALFTHLGVTHPNVRDIRLAILRRYSQVNGSSSGRNGITLEMSSHHIKFLYLTDRERPSDTVSHAMQIYDEDNYLRDPGRVDIYIADDHPYGARALLGVEGARSLGVFFLSPEYRELVPDNHDAAGLALNAWMGDYLGVQQHIRLISRDGRSLSRECAYVAEHRPADFLGFLEHVWPMEGERVLADAGLLRTLGETKVLCRGGNMECIKNAYLPLPELESSLERFMEDGEYFPVIHPPHPDCDFSIPFWKQFGLRWRNDLDFRLSIMLHIQLAHLDDGTVPRPTRVLDLYRFIESSCMESEDRQMRESEVYDFFEKESLVLLPLRSAGDPDWVTPSECCWDAPEDAISTYPLRALYHRAFTTEEADISILAGFFRRTLKIPDMDWEDVILELSTIRESLSAQNPSSICELYGRLRDQAMADRPSIKEAFEEHSLIYAPQQPGTPSWWKPSACLWSSAASIAGKAVIGSLYSELEDLFVRDLGVPSLDLQLLLTELIKMPAQHASVEDVRLALWALNSLLDPEGGNDPPSRRLLEARVLPVRRPDGRVELVSSTEAEFAINDRDDYFDMFRNSITVLDFKLHEVRRLQPILAWMRLERRYLSRCVREESRLHGGSATPISSTNKDVRNKAYGLLRVAATYNSPRFNADAQGLYKLLRDAATLEARGISSLLVLRQNDTDHNVGVATSELHIHDSSDSLTIYIPENEVDQDFCFTSKLPQRLASWLMADPAAAIAVNTADNAIISAVKSVLGCSTRNLSRVLQVEGIMEIDIPDLTEEDARAREPPSSSTPLRSQASRTPSSSVETPYSSPGNDSDYPTPLTNPDDYDEPAGRRIPGYVDSPIRFRGDVGDTQYKRLLEKVVWAARTTMSIPDLGQDGVLAMFRGLSVVDDDVFDGLGASYFSSQPERNIKIGAAGELLVFEILSHLEPDLPGFGRHNWQSRIRGHVRPHADYAGLGHWSGMETSDIVYDDTHGVLTSILARKGYLTGGHWRDQRPRYYIEVKTTMDACSTPLFVSENQYERMQRTTNGPLGDRNLGEVYIIFRVFNLGRGSMGLSLYVDPEEHRRKGTLRFTTDKWTVVPSTP